MKVLKKYGVNLVVLAILAGMIIVRVTSYGDLNLSVANADTKSYIEGGTAPVVSKGMLTKNRLFTTNLLYHLTNVQKCEIQAVSYPALGKEVYRFSLVLTGSCFFKI
jgi:hypothetical protein